MKKIISIIVCMILLVISTAGCAKATDSGRNIQTGTITVTDQLGREVTLPEQPERVVSSYYITTSLIIALGGTEKLVGIEMKPESRPIYQKAAPGLLELPQVGNSKSISVEECAALEAQVVIIPVKLKEFIEPLEKLGISVIAVEPESLEQFMECIALVGTILGEQEQAEKLSGFYKEKTSFAADITKNISDGDKPSVLMFGSELNEACTPQMYQSTIIQMAGGHSVTEGLTDKKWATVSAEQIMKWNPQVMINLSYSTFSIEEIKQDKVLSQTEAAQLGQLYTFPSALEPWDYPTPSSALGILWLTHILHPDAYERDAYLKDAKDFYKEYYGIDVSEEELGV